jgi:formylglycine-generating enzyme required for sulfatase activity
MTNVITTCTKCKAQFSWDTDFSGRMPDCPNCGHNNKTGTKKQTGGSKKKTATPTSSQKVACSRCGEMIWKSVAKSNGGVCRTCPQVAASTSSQKVPCSRCGEMIWKSMAKSNGGRCHTCADPGWSTTSEKPIINEELSPGSYVSNEDLPPGKSRCPRCNKIHSIESSRIQDREVSGEEAIGKAALAAFYKSIDSQMEVIHLRCPHCEGTYEVTHGIYEGEGTSEQAEADIDDSLDEGIDESAKTGNWRPGETVPQSGKYKCIYCGPNGMGATMLKGMGLPYDLPMFARKPPTKDFNAGDTFSSCPNCKNAPGGLDPTGWELVSEREIKTSPPMVYFECPPPSGDGTCSDDSCPCGYPGANIPQGSGYLYISKELVEMRRDALSLAAIEKKITDMQQQMDFTMMSATSGVFVPILMCELGAKKRGLDLMVASADAKHWWKKGMVPLRPTPMIGETSTSTSSQKVACTIEKTKQKSIQNRKKFIIFAAHLLFIIVATMGIINLYRARAKSKKVTTKSILSLSIDLIVVRDAQYASLSGLASGSRTAQALQKEWSSKLGLPLEVETKKTGIKLRLIPPGTFSMGRPFSKDKRDSDETQHRVTLTKAFYCGKFEITQGQWKYVMCVNPSQFTSAGDNAPVEQVSWDDCQKFLNKLCALEGVPRGTYRLLTEAQWEYACRAGTSTAFCCYGRASFDGNNYRRKTISVGSFKSNAWGLYDMHGNVWEWCNDWYGTYLSGSVTDPTGTSSSSFRVYRGGSWRNYARDCRSAIRGRNTPSYRGNGLGFRFLRAIPVKK